MAAYSDTTKLNLTQFSLHSLYQSFMDGTFLFLNAISDYSFIPLLLDRKSTRLNSSHP